MASKRSLGSSLQHALSPHAPVGIDRSLCLELVILLVSFVPAVDE